MKKSQLRNIMKKSQLNNIIRESIKQLMTEQTTQYTMSNIQDAITAAPVDFKYTVCREEAEAAGYWTGGATGCFFITLPNASAQQLQTPFLTGNYSLVDAANDPNSGFYSFEYGGVNDCPAGCAAYNSTPPNPCATSTNPNCGSTCYTCVNGVIYQEDPSFATSPGGGWVTSYGTNPDVCGYGQIAALPSNAPSAPFDPSNSSIVSGNPLIPVWWNSDTTGYGGQEFTYLGCSYPGGTTTTPVVLNPGCTVVQSPNYDATADGCEVNGVVDPNDVSCCVPVQPGGSTTPTNVGQQNADNPALQVADPITPTPNPNDPQIKRMKDLAFRGKRKR